MSSRFPDEGAVLGILFATHCETRCIPLRKPEDGIMGPLLTQGPGDRSLPEEFSRGPRWGVF